MKSETLQLTVRVMSPQGSEHYLLHRSIHSLDELMGIYHHLTKHQISFEYKPGNSGLVLIIKQPNYSDDELQKYNELYFSALGICELHKLKQDTTQGDGVFWTCFDEKETEFVKKMFSSKCNEELEHNCNVSEATISRQVKRILDIVNLKYPNQKLKNRRQFRLFGKSIGVYTEQICPRCGRIQ